MSQPNGCVRCGHQASRHWPEHERTTTACATCIDLNNYTARDGDGQMGICCYRADVVRK